MDAEELIEVGLTKNQAKVYLEVMVCPEQTGGEIAKKLSIDRSFAYNVLSSLIDKGLITYITKQDKRLFYPSDPENLLNEIEEEKNKISKLVDKLKLIEKQKKLKRSVKIYEGKSGLKAYVRNFLNTDSFVTFGGGGNLKILEVLKYTYPQYLKEFNRKKIEGKLITSPQNKDIAKNLYKNSNVKIKNINGLKSEVNFTIFKDNLAIYSAEKKPFVIIIEDKNIANCLKQYFDKLWQFIN
ncbi:MAG: hypothetical protein KAT28_04865 [Candidatus Aenigmarchaeota archaeon]|nr:hypothetical protein [Candidatus Aenigmarchaeota archaeon]